VVESRDERHGGRDFVEPVEQFHVADVPDMHDEIDALQCTDRLDRKVSGAATCVSARNPIRWTSNWPVREAVMGTPSRTVSVFSMPLGVRLERTSDLRSGDEVKERSGFSAVKTPVLSAAILRQTGSMRVAMVDG